MLGDSLSMIRPFLEALGTDALVSNPGSVLHELCDLGEPQFPHLSRQHALCFLVLIWESKE